MPLRLPRARRRHWSAAAVVVALALTSACGATDDAASAACRQPQLTGHLYAVGGPDRRPLLRADACDLDFAQVADEGPVFEVSAAKGRVVVADGTRGGSALAEVDARSLRGIPRLGRPIGYSPQLRGDQLLYLTLDTTSSPPHLELRTWSFSNAVAATLPVDGVLSTPVWLGDEVAVVRQEEPRPEAPPTTTVDGEDVRVAGPGTEAGPPEIVVLAGRRVVRTIPVDGMPKGAGLVSNGATLLAVNPTGGEWRTVILDGTSTREISGWRALAWKPQSDVLLLVDRDDHLGLLVGDRPVRRVGDAPAGLGSVAWTD